MKRRSTSDQTEIRLQTPNLDESIRRRAYELYEKRGRLDGRDIDDWLQAEAELAHTSKAAVA